MEKPAAVVVLALIVIMLIVPWFLARQSPDMDAPRAASRRAGAVPGSLFTSARERRLWLWTMAVQLAIYSTLGPAAGLVTALRAHNLLRVSMAALVFVVGGVVVVRWARTQPGRCEKAVALGVAAVYVTALIKMPAPEERTHLFEYGLVALLIEQAFTERRRNGRGVPPRLRSPLWQPPCSAGSTRGSSRSCSAASTTCAMWGSTLSRG